MSSRFLRLSVVLVPLLALAGGGTASGEEATPAYASRAVDGMSSELKELIAQSFEPSYVTVRGPGVTLAGLLVETCGAQPRAVEEALAAEALKLNRLQSMDETLVQGDHAQGGVGRRLRVVVVGCRGLGHRRRTWIGLVRIGAEGIAIDNGRCSLVDIPDGVVLRHGYQC